jgi:anti-anti-sigma factor
MQNNITLSVSYENDKTVVSIGGDVTAVTGEEIIGAYKKTSDEGSQKFVLNFEPGCYINSGGLAYLIDIASKSRQKNQTVCVCGLSDHFMKIFKMVGLTRCFDTFRDKDEAINSPGRE